MGKKSASTIENRVYLFKDLASAFVASHGELLASAREPDRRRALRALADLAYASCVVADTGHLDGGEVAELVGAGGPGTRERPAGKREKK